MSLIGSIGGIQAIDVEGDRMVVVRNGGEIEVYERGLNDAWALLGRNEELLNQEAKNSTSELSVSGDVGLLTTDARSAVFFDLSDPSAPAVISEVDYADASETYIDDVWIGDGTAVIAGRAWFRTYDVSNAAAPTLLAHRENPAYNSVEIREGVLYAWRPGAGVTFWDLSDPANPAVATTLPFARSCSYDNGRIAAGIRQGSSVRIELYDAADMYSPTLIGSLDLNSAAGFDQLTGMTLRGDRLIATNIETMLYYSYGSMYDVSDPGSISLSHASWSLNPPAQADPYESEAVFDEIHEQGDAMLFVSDGQVWAYDDLDTAFTMSHVAGQRALLPLAEHNGGLLVWDRGRVLWGSDTGIDSFSGSVVVDVLEALPRVDQYFVRAIDPGDGLVYVAVADPDANTSPQIRLYSIDMLAPSGPEVVYSHVIWNADFLDMVYSGGTLYLSDHRSGEFRIIETTLSGALVDHGVTSFSVGFLYTQDLTFASESLLGVASYESGAGNSLDLSLFDLSNPLSPVPVSQILDADIEAPCVSVGDFMFSNIAGSNDYGFFDLTDPAMPINRTGTGVALPEGAQLISGKDGILYFLSGSQLLFVDVTDPTDHRIVRAGSLNPAGAGAIAAPSEFGDGEVASILGTSLFRSNMKTEDVIQIDLAVCSDVCAADLNDDGLLDFFDVSEFLNAQIDFNGDGSFDFFDASAFLAAYNAGCP